jgi:hypothetical protein
MSSRYDKIYSVLRAISDKSETGVISDKSDTGVISDKSDTGVISDRSDTGVISDKSDFINYVHNSTFDSLSTYSHP